MYLNHLFSSLFYCGVFFWSSSFTSCGTSVFERYFGQCRILKIFGCFCFGLSCRPWCLSAGWDPDCLMPRSGHSRSGLRDLSTLALAVEQGVCHRTITLVLHRRKSLPICTNLHGSDQMGSMLVLISFSGVPLVPIIPSRSGSLSVSGFTCVSPSSLSLPGALFPAFLAHVPLQGPPCPPSSSKAGACSFFITLTLIVATHSTHLCILPCFPRWNLNSIRTWWYLHLHFSTLLPSMVLAHWVNSCDEK